MEFGSQLRYQHRVNVERSLKHCAALNASMKNCSTPNDVICTATSRKRARGLSENLLRTVCLRVASQVHHAIVPEIEPLMNESQYLKLPRFSDQAKTPHYCLPINNSKQKKGKYPMDSFGTNAFNSPTAVDLTEPPFENFSSLWIDDVSNSSRHLDRTRKTFNANFSAIDRSNGMDVGFRKRAGKSTRSRNSKSYTGGCDENSAEYQKHIGASSSKMNEQSANARGNGSISNQSLNNWLRDQTESSTGFKLFRFYVVQLLRIPKTLIPRVVLECWIDLSETEKTAFEMHVHVLRENNQFQLLNHIEMLADDERIEYLDSQRDNLSQILGSEFVDTFNPKNVRVFPDENNTNRRRKINKKRFNDTTVVQGDFQFIESLNDSNGIKLLPPPVLPIHIPESNLPTRNYDTPFSSTSKISWKLEDERYADTTSGQNSLMSWASSSTITSTSSESMFHTEAYNEDPYLHGTLMEDDTLSDGSDSSYNCSDTSVVSVVQTC